MEWIVKPAVALFLGLIASTVIGLAFVFMLEIPDLVSRIFDKDKDRKGMTKYILKRHETKED